VRILVQAWPLICAIFSLTEAPPESVSAALSSSSLPHLRRNGSGRKATSRTLMFIRQPLKPNRPKRRAACSHSCLQAAPHQRAVHPRHARLLSLCVSSNNRLCPAPQKWPHLTPASIPASRSNVPHASVQRTAAPKKRRQRGQ